jgi:23S rRNA (cytidine2498-2'-O)-methyltransferase
VDRLHVWSRDRDEPGRWGYEPRPTPDDEQVRSALLAAMPPNTAAETLLAAQRAPAATDLPAPPIHHPDAMRTAPTAVGHRVLDCILVERDQWWVGHHVVRQIPSRWPGGLFHCPLPPEAVSRTYLKMREALAWSQLPVRAGDRFVEIGSAPGGASQALLELGLHVIGIDPADMAPQVLAHPSFEHWKMRGSDVRRRRFRGVRWLAADINVAPCYTLDMVEDIVTHPAVEIHGLLLTLKLLDWSLADDIPEHLARVRSWGFARVKARQLHHNRQEFCVAALRQPTRRRRR